MEFGGQQDRQLTRRLQNRRLAWWLLPALALHGLLLLPLEPVPPPPTEAGLVTVELEWAKTTPPAQPEPVAFAAWSAPALDALPAPPGVPDRATDAPEPAAGDGGGVSPLAEEAATTALARRLLAEPFIENRDVVAELFGPDPAAPSRIPAFQLPERTDMVAMLSPPLPELPFADPQLVSFMYAPGVTGDLHRGFDRITPEFGWTSNTGFKIRCRWILVLVACGWGR